MFGLNIWKWEPQIKKIGRSLLNLYRIRDARYTEDVFFTLQSIYDLIDYYLREWARREQKMRVCKNCGKYFAITGRTNAEYCDRVFDSKGRTCKDVGASGKITLEEYTTCLKEP